MTRILSRYPGVYYRDLKNQHQGRPDRSWEFCVTVDGKQNWTNVGRLSEGMTAERARDLRSAAVIARRTKDPFLGDLVDRHLVGYAGGLHSAEAVCIRRNIVDKHIRPLADMRVSELTPTFLKGWAEDKGKTLARRTVNGLGTALRQVVQSGVDAGLVDGPNPVGRIPKVGEVVMCERYLADDEAEWLVDRLRSRPGDWGDMAVLSLETGIRCVELYRMRLADVDIESKTLRVLAKSGKREALLLTDRALEVILSRPPTDGPVFPKQEHRHFVWAAAPLNEGVTDVRRKVRFHTFRHTFATRLVKRHVDLYAVQRLMRHASPQMTQRYAHLGQSDLRAALDRLSS